MKKSSVFLMSAVVVLMAVLTACGTQRSQAYYDYESKVIGTELDGSYTIRAWGRARNGVDAYVQASRQCMMSSSIRYSLLQVRRLLPQAYSNRCS